MQIRSLTAALALLTAFPLSAEPLSEGQFMVAQQILPDGIVPRFFSFHVEGSALEVQVFWLSPLSLDSCEAAGRCDTEVTAATANANVQDGRVQLQDVALSDDTAIFESASGPNHDSYTRPLLAIIDGAEFRAADHGFVLTQGGVEFPFHAVSAEARDAIRAYPEVFQLPVTELRGCHISGLAALFANLEPTQTELLFRQAMTGYGMMMNSMIEQRELERQAQATGNAMAADQSRALMIRNIIPHNLASVEPGPDETPIDALWRTFFLDPLAGDRAAYDDMIAFYGDALPGLAAFSRHMSSTEIEYDFPAICDDLSHGFIGSE